MKDEQLIKKLIKKGESEQLEFKESVHRDTIAKIICGFLNAKGGVAFIGIGYQGKPIGVKNAVAQAESLNQYLYNSITPEAPVSVSVESFANKQIIMVKVGKGSNTPYVFGRDIYIRKEDQTKKATAEDISSLIVERSKTELHWERQLTLGIELKDLDELQIRKTINDLKKYGRGKIFSEPEEFLSHYGLFQNGNLTNAAVVLFAKNPTRFLPQCRVRLTVFKGSKSSDSFIYDKIYEGNLFQIIEELFQFFEVNIAVKSKFSDLKWQREDIAYPKLALREGLMNALIHRDYSNISGSVIIAFYPDHLEITNYGQLPPELKPADLAKNHLSLPRNPDIAHICYLRQMIEKIGRGTIKMIEDCESKGYPKPIWQSESGRTTLTFPKITVTAKTDDVVNDAVNDAVKKNLIDAVSDVVSDALIDTVNVVIASDKGVSINEIMNKTSKSNATVKRYLHLLKAIKMIEYKGASKTGRYFITPKTLSIIKKKT